MPYTTAFTNQILEHVHGKTALTMPTVHLGLSTTTPTLAGGNVTEPVGNGYARVTTSGATWGTAASGAITNAVDITFPTATGSWGTVTHVVAFSASTGGSVLWYDDLPAGIAIGASTTFRIPTGDADSTIA